MSSAAQREELGFLVLPTCERLLEQLCRRAALRHALDRRDHLVRDVRRRVALEVLELYRCGLVLQIASELGSRGRLVAGPAMATQSIIAASYLYSDNSK